MASGSLDDQVKADIENTPVLVYSKTWCPYCDRAKRALQVLGIDVIVYELDKMSDGDAIQGAVERISHQRTVPNIFVGGTHIGGCDDMMAMIQTGKFRDLLALKGIPFNE